LLEDCVACLLATVCRDGSFEYHVIGPHIMVLDDRLYEDHAMGLLVVACHDQSFEDHAIGLLTICMRIML